MPAPLTVSDLLEKLREARKVPIGVLSYDMGTDEMKFSFFGDIDPLEGNALLEKLGITVLIGKKT